jgi:DNA-binding GntR family transcriptional regulator
VIAGLRRRSLEEARAALRGHILGAADRLYGFEAETLASAG